MRRRGFLGRLPAFLIASKLVLEQERQEPVEPEPCARCRGHGIVAYDCSPAQFVARFGPPGGSDYLPIGGFQRCTVQLPCPACRRDAWLDQLRDLGANLSESITAAEAVEPVRGSTRIRRNHA